MKIKSTPHLTKEKVKPSVIKAFREAFVANQVAEIDLGKGKISVERWFNTDDLEAFILKVEKRAYQRGYRQGVKITQLKSNAMVDALASY